MPSNDDTCAPEGQPAGNVRFPLVPAAAAADAETPLAGVAAVVVGVEDEPAPDEDPDGWQAASDNPATTVKAAIAVLRDMDKPAFVRHRRR